MVHTSQSFAKGGQGTSRRDEIITQEAQSTRSDRNPEGKIIRQAVSEIVDEIRSRVF